MEVSVHRYDIPIQPIETFDLYQRVSRHQTCAILGFSACFVLPSSAGGDPQQARSVPILHLVRCGNQPRRRTSVADLHALLKATAWPGLTIRNQPIATRYQCFVDSTV